MRHVWYRRSTVAPPATSLKEANISLSYYSCLIYKKNYKSWGTATPFTQIGAINFFFIVSKIQNITPIALRCEIALSKYTIE